MSAYIQHFHCLCCNQEGGIVSVCIYFGIWYCFDDIVDVEIEEGRGEGAALWDSVGDGSHI